MTNSESMKETSSKSLTLVYCPTSPTFSSMCGNANNIARSAADLEETNKSEIITTHGNTST